MLFTASIRAQDFTYTTTAGQITITGYTGAGGAVAIPATITGLPVTAIGDHAFFARTLTSVTIPNSVTSIGYYAFRECTGLASVTIGNSVARIESYAFSQCRSLGSVTIPDSVTIMGHGAFEHCESLTSVTIPNSVPIIGNTAFWGCTSLTNVTIGKSVTSIGSYAFAHCISLTSVTIPKSVTSVADNAFRECTGLASVTIGNGVTSIGDYAFGACTSLTNVTIGKSVTSIGDNAFLTCYSLTGVYFAGNAPTTVAFDLFKDADKATVYYLPGTTGWSSSFGRRPTALRDPTVPTDHPSFGVQAQQFGFTITGPSNLVVVVEACTSLTSPSWSPVGTNTLTGGSSYFSDPQWSSFPTRIYRLRSP